MVRSKQHIPIRTCISCGVKRSKKDLVRLALDSDGHVLKDEKGQISGRGAYVCDNPSCLGRLDEVERLRRAFRTKAGSVRPKSITDSRRG
jgi:predicted RNA-binding protein YlxR (DUF448 family)